VVGRRLRSFGGEDASPAEACELPQDPWDQVSRTHKGLSCFAGSSLLRRTSFRQRAAASVRGCSEEAQRDSEPEKSGLSLGKPQDSYGCESRRHFRRDRSLGPLPRQQGDIIRKRGMPYLHPKRARSGQLRRMPG